MAKLTRAVCDFCGGTLGDPHGTLTLPVIDAAGQTKPKAKTEAEMAYAMFSLGGLFGTDTKTRSFDICRACGEGLVRWRHEVISKFMAEGFEKA